MARFQRTRCARSSPRPSARFSSRLPDVGWEDVGGLEERQATAGRGRRMAPAARGPVRARRNVSPPKGILLSGPPGTRQDAAGQGRGARERGQLHFGEGAGAALACRSANPRRPSARSSARRAQAAPCILFFDEIDALVAPRGGGGDESHVTERVISQFLTEMDGIEELRAWSLGRDQPPSTAWTRPSSVPAVWTSWWRCRRRIKDAPGHSRRAHPRHAPRRQGGPGRVGRRD